MARIRTIKPSFFRHGELFEAEKAEGMPLRVAFAGLWTAADREGRFPWKPQELKLDCLPFDDVDFSRVLDALATRGFIVKYASGGKEYGFIPSWHTHQVINNRETPSTIPQPIETESTSTRAPRVPHACPTPLVQVQGEGKGREGKDAASNDAQLPLKETSDEADLYRRGKAVLGASAGGLIASLLKSKKGSVPLARSAIEMAATKQDAREYIGRIIHGRADEIQNNFRDPLAGIQ